MRSISKFFIYSRLYYKMYTRQLSVASFSFPKNSRDIRVNFGSNASFALTSVSIPKVFRSQISLIMKLADFLKDFLPKGKTFEVLHIQSNPRETHPLVTQQHTSDNITTIKVPHFITLSHNELIFFGLEIFVYTTINHTNSTTETLLFVSKADTNGLNLSHVKIHLITTKIIQYLLLLPISTYLQNIVPKQIHSKEFLHSITRSTPTKAALNILIKRAQGEPIPTQIKPFLIKEPTNYRNITKIALFTRPEPQYLFPGSGKNTNKHILTGDGLLKWWLSVLDSLLEDSFDQSGTSANLRIPAEEEPNVARYLAPLKFPNWKVGDIFSGGAKDLAVHHIPVFPDDPKTRYLEHLVVEGLINSITMEQFWNELQIRQEFRLGVTVSVIGIEGQLKPSNHIHEAGLSLSHRHFKKVKTYVTGEDYTPDRSDYCEGAFEAHCNITDYLKYHFHHDLPEVCGKFTSEPKRETKRPVLHTLNPGLVRKKPKK